MEEIRSAESGLRETQVAALVAIFDLDRTMIPGSSTAAFARLLVHRRVLPKALLVRHAVRAAWFARRGMSDARLVRLGEAALAAVDGLPHQPVLELAAETAPMVAATMYPAARWLLDRHLQAGHFCVLLSAGPQELVEAVGSELGFHRSVGTRAVVRDGRLTGALDGPLCHGAGKLIRLRSEVGPVDLRRATAYGDSGGDIALLTAARNPVAVHPDRRLRAHALAAGWPILRFQ
jgi:HAD superfamily hydrolase (TIGR01490 family)